MKQIKRIKWVEAAKANGRYQKIEAANLIGIESVGYVIEETDNAVILGSSILAGAVENILVIPKSSIIEEYDLQDIEVEEATD